MITLYRSNKLGVGTWRIWAEGNVVKMAHSTVSGGAEVFHEEVVPIGLAGRTLEQQVISRVQSRINRQRDRGYVDSHEIASTQPVLNTLNLPPPMLAKKLDDLRVWPGKVIVQPKLDGFRCLVTRRPDGSVICYSRQGKELDALRHIATAFEGTLPDGIILDGEIYRHGTPLQTIASLAKKAQPGTEKLVLHVYDSISRDMFPDRYADAATAVAVAASDRVVVVPNQVAKTANEVWDYFEDFRVHGYEGAMVRIPSSPYESGTRSSGLLKVKAREDAEFEVTGVVEGSDGLGVLVCKMPSGRTFRTLAPGPHDQKRFVFVHRDQFIGRRVTVEYANLTNDGIPFHPVATRWRPLTE